MFPFYKKRKKYRRRKRRNYSTDDLLAMPYSSIIPERRYTTRDPDAPSEDDGGEKPEDTEDKIIDMTKHQVAVEIAKFINMPDTTLYTLLNQKSVYDAVRVYIDQNINVSKNPDMLVDLNKMGNMTWKEIYQNRTKIANTLVLLYTDFTWDLNLTKYGSPEEHANAIGTVWRNYQQKLDSKEKRLRSKAVLKLARFTAWIEKHATEIQSKDLSLKLPKWIVAMTGDEFHVQLNPLYNDVNSTAITVANVTQAVSKMVCVYNAWNSYRKTNNIDTLLAGLPLPDSLKSFTNITAFAELFLAGAMLRSGWAGISGIVCHFIAGYVEGVYQETVERLGSKASYGQLSWPEQVELMEACAMSSVLNTADIIRWPRNVLNRYFLATKDPNYRTTAKDIARSLLILNGAKDFGTFRMTPQSAERYFTLLWWNQFEAEFINSGAIAKLHPGNAPITLWQKAIPAFMEEYTKHWEAEQSRRHWGTHSKWVREPFIQHSKNRFRTIRQYGPGKIAQVMDFLAWSWATVTEPIICGFGIKYDPWEAYKNYKAWIYKSVMPSQKYFLNITEILIQRHNATAWKDWKEFMFRMYVADQEGMSAGFHGKNKFYNDELQALNLNLSVKFKPGQPPNTSVIFSTPHYIPIAKMLEWNRWHAEWVLNHVEGMPAFNYERFFQDYRWLHNFRANSLTKKERREYYHATKQRIPMQQLSAGGEDGLVPYEPGVQLIMEGDDRQNKAETV